MSDQEIIECESKRHLTRPVLLSTSNLCVICQNPVFISERVLFGKKLYHRSCFRCFNCGCVLNPHTAEMSPEGLLICLESLCQAEFHKRSHESSLNNDPETQNDPSVDGASSISSACSSQVKETNKEINNNPFDEEEEENEPIDTILNEGEDQLAIGESKVNEGEIQIYEEGEIELNKGENEEVGGNVNVVEEELSEEVLLTSSENSLSTVPSKLELVTEGLLDESGKDEPADSLVNQTEDKPKPNAIQLWINKDYYPAELNPFESEDTLRDEGDKTGGTREKSTEEDSMGKNPFDDDEEDESEEYHNLPSRTTPKSRIPTPAKRTLEANLGDPKAKPRKNPAPPPPQLNSRNNAANFSVPPPEVNPLPKSPVSILKPVPSKKFDNPPPLSPESSEILAKRPVPSPRSKRRAPRAPQVPPESTPMPTERKSSPNVSIQERRKSRSPSPSNTSSQRKTIKSPPKNVQRVNEGQNPRNRSTSPKARSTSPKARSTSPKVWSISSKVRNVSPKGQSIEPGETEEQPKQKVIKPPPGLMKGLKTHEGNSSVGSKYKKKRRAPPPRRKVEPLPEDAIKRELADLEVKERELERQGIALEGNIRNFMTQIEDGDEEQVEMDEKSEQLDKMMIQLWSVVNEKNDILRRQTELEYLRRGHRLEEMQAELEFQVRVLMNTPLQDRTEDHATVEQMLIHRMLKLVDERNEVVEWLDYHRQVEREEEVRISQSFGSFSLRPNSRTSSRSRSGSPGPMVVSPVSPDSGKKNKKNKEKKKEKSSSGKLKIGFFGKKKRKGSKASPLTDEDKDKDESEV